MIFRLKHIREQRNMTQEQVADLTGLSKSFLSQIETGSRKPSTGTISLLATALNVAEADLIESSGFAEPAPFDTVARRVLKNLDAPPPAADADLKIGTDGKHVQVVATVDREGLKRLIRQLQAMEHLLDI